MSTTIDYYYYSYYYGENTTMNQEDVPVSPNSTDGPANSSSAGSTMGTPRSSGMDQGDDEFLPHVMYGMIAAVGLIVIVIAVCFVYRSKKRASANIRRCRPKSRPGALSLELLERDLLQSGLPHAANQPLYGFESIETTEFSDVSSGVVRADSHKHNTRTSEHPEENGAPANVQQLTNHIEKQFEGRKKSNVSVKRMQNESIQRNISESTTRKGSESSSRNSNESLELKRAGSTKRESGQSTSSKPGKDGQTEPKRAFKPPILTPTGQKRFPQNSPTTSKGSPRTPTTPLTQLKTVEDKTVDEKDIHVGESTSISTETDVSPDYENTDVIKQHNDNVGECTEQPTYINTTEAAVEKRKAKLDTSCNLTKSKRNEITKNECTSSKNKASRTDENSQLDLTNAVQTQKKLPERQKSLQKKSSPVTVKIPPSVPAKPSNKTKVLKNDKSPNAEKSHLVVMVPDAPSVYEDPDELESTGFALAERNDMDMYTNTSVSNVEDIDEAEDSADGPKGVQCETKDKSETFMYDINTTVPPPPPCNSNAGSYINASTHCSTEQLHDVSEQKCGYVNVPKLSRSAKDVNENTYTEECLEYENIDEKKAPTSLNLLLPSAKDVNENTYTEECLAYANLDEKKAPTSLNLRLPPPSSCTVTPGYVNANMALKKRGYSASCLPEENKYETSWSDIRSSVDGTLGSVDGGEYIAMGECHDDNVYIVMGDNDNVYLDMRGASSAADAFDEAGSQDSGNEYVNTKCDTSNGHYSVPRANPYKTVGGKAKTMRQGKATPQTVVGRGPNGTAGRSRSTDAIYDYADMRSVQLNRSPP